MISNRKQIEKFCTDRNLKVHSLKYIRNRDYIYGDSVDSSHWELSIYLDENNINMYDTLLGDTIIDGINLMFNSIDEDIRELIN